MKSKKDWKGSIGLALLLIAAVTVVILCFYGARQTAPPEGGAPAAAAEPVQPAGDEAAASADRVAAVIRYIREDLGGVIPDEYRSPQGRITIIGVTPQAPEDFTSS